MMNNIYLIGYRGTGKTTLAPKLAAALGYTAIEMDERIAHEAGQSVADIFQSRGEPFFRSLESKLLSDLSRHNKQVISTGGGIVLAEDNRKVMRNTGVVIWLKATPQTVLKRLAESKEMRPALTSLTHDEEVHHLMRQRAPFYQEAAHFLVDTDQQNLEDTLIHLQRLLDGSDYV